ncbi:MAG: O-acetyl-ADP-ribose deacetylase [Syntrophus sp. PtaB.Bin001]|nr:MAG: O-acetyl-ADP-ribose deacetylase [Syntrophus sp. PtaB.Bin001]
MEIRIGNSLLVLVQGDITQEDTDALVNTANSRLAGGGGVDGAIHRAGGPAIMAECRKIGGCPTGQAVITTGGNLKARYVIHTVGPIYRDGSHGEEELLAGAYRESLKLASARNLKSLSFPAISAGVYGYPLQEAARIALTTVIEYLKNHQDIELVRFVLFGQKIFDVFSAVLKDLSSEIPK